MGRISFFGGTVDEVFGVLLSLVFPAIVVVVVVVVVAAAAAAVVEPCYTIIYIIQMSGLCFCRA